MSPDRSGFAPRGPKVLALILYAGAVQWPRRLPLVAALAVVVVVPILLVALYLSRFPIVRHGGLWMFASVAVFGLSTLTFGLSHWFWLSAFVLLVNLVVLGYFVAALHSVIMGTVKVITRTMEDMGRGDLTRRRTVHGDDELSGVGRGMQQVGDRLSGMVASIRTNAVLLAMAGKRMSEGSMALAMRTEQQAGRLKQLVDSFRI